MNISQKGVDLIKSFEGLSLKAYKVEGAGEKYWTIGYGHYGSDVDENERISKSGAEKLLKEDLKRYVESVDEYVTVDINQNQFDALVSFCYNVGQGALHTSTLLKKVNNKDFIGASKEFEKWVNAGGKRMSGLVKRRIQEKELFLKPVPVVKKSIIYVVKAGDTLGGIATKYDTTIAKIKQSNKNVKDVNKIFVGQKLKID